MKAPEPGITVAMTRPVGAIHALTTLCVALVCACADGSTAPPATSPEPVDPEPASPPSYCESTLGQAYEPADSSFLGALPDDWFTFEDPESPTRPCPGGAVTGRGRRPGL